MKYTIDTTNKTIQLLEECTLFDISELLDSMFEEKGKCELYEDLMEWKLIPKETIKIEKEPHYVPYKLQEEPYKPYINPITQPQVWYGNNVCNTTTIGDLNFTDTGEMIDIENNIN